MNDTAKSLFNITDFEALYERLLGEVSEISAYVMSVCAIGALLYICFKVFGPWTRGESIDFYSLLRPFAIGLVIMNFSMVPDFIDMCLKPVEKYTASLKEDSKDDYKAKANELKDAFTNYYKRILKPDENADNIFEAIYNVVKKLDPVNLYGTAMKMTLMNALLVICMFLCELVVFALMVFMIVTKILLVILGPLVFTLAIFPKFDGGIKQWLCRYINVSLWIPVANIVGYVIQQLFITVIFDPVIRSLNSDASVAETSATAVGPGYMLMFFILACILYCSVPKLTGWIVDENGAGMIGGAVGGAFKTAAGAAAGYAASQIAMGKAMASNLSGGGNGGES